jgi:ribosome-binding factor A
MKRGYDRTRRVADLIQKTLAQMLVEDMGGDEFNLVTITGANVSRDLSYAKIYVSVLTDKEETIKQTVAALNRNAKNFRYELAQAVKLRIAPELKFVYDEATAHGFHISGLIDKAVKRGKGE